MLILWKLILFLKFPCYICNHKFNNLKEKILIKAIDLFINYGFKSVTMDDIASEMHISKKTIYSHFNNKTELVEA